MWRNFGVKTWRRYSTGTKKYVQVCVLGADTPTGRLTSFLLKQNPLVNLLHLQGTSRVEAIGLDLSHLDTNCKVQTYTRGNSASAATKSADVILMMGLESYPKQASIAKIVMAEGPRIVELATVCSKFAPKSLMVVCVNPISVTLPLVAEVYKKTHWYHPGRIMGSAALVQIKANSLVGNYQNLDPQIVDVPIVGGPDLDCALPLFSQASPVGVASKDAEHLLEAFKEDSQTLAVSHAVGLNRMVTSIGLGLCGDDNAVVSAFIRTNVINTCRHLVAAVRVGKGGVVHNFGLPRLAKSELHRFEKCALALKLREEMASDFLVRSSAASLPSFMLREQEEEEAAKRGILR